MKNKQPTKSSHRQSPICTNDALDESFNQLIRRVNHLTQSILHNVSLNSKLSEIPGTRKNAHQTFTQRKCLQLIQSRLQSLLLTTEDVMKCLQRYRRLIEKFLHDFRRDIYLGQKTTQIRQMQLGLKVDDGVQKVMEAEITSMLYTKKTFELHLYRLCVVIKELEDRQRMLVHCSDVHKEKLESMLVINGVLRSMDFRDQASTLIGELNDLYSLQWSPRNVMKSLTETSDEALSVRKMLDCMLARVPFFVQGTRLTLQGALMDHAASNVMKETRLTLAEVQRRKAKNRCLRIECKLRSGAVSADPTAMKCIEQNYASLEEAKSQLRSNIISVRNVARSDVGVLQIRRKELKHRLAPDVGLTRTTTVL